MKKVLTLIGPTAVGKTSICLELGENYPIEVISADSRQVYKGMDIGTAKITKEEMQKVPHHLIDIKEPNDDYSAYEFICDCKKKVKEIRERKNIPIICGGTIFYIRSLIEGMFEEPEIPGEIRDEVRREIKEKGLEQMHIELKRIDSESAKRIHPNDKQRLGRALEVYRASGITLTEFWKKGNKNKIPLEVFALLIDKKGLRHRIEKRVLKMFEDGFIGEVKTLIDEGYTPSLYSFTSIGYGQVSDYLSNGNNKTLEDLKKTVIKETKKYADRQITFIKGLPEVKIFKNKEKLKVALIEKIQKEKN
ncbi:MAG: tRNA (adenosine(37)-N6)-dimethylallyltransferase MiaA [candidate division WOR-3 bacterium]